MAKGLRSKTMKKNRTLLREGLVVPIIKKREEKLAESMKKTLEDRSGGSIEKLRSIFSNNSKNETTQVNESQRELLMPSITKKQAKVFDIVKKLKGSKKRDNPGKTMTWF